MIKHAVLAAFGVAALAACSIDPKDYETEPVTVQTPQGPVLCQLYSKNIVSWDRAIDLPSGMELARADRYCQKEGQLLK